MSQPTSDINEAKANLFRVELEGLLRKHGLDELSQTPDFILAGYVIRCLAAFDMVIATVEAYNAGSEFVRYDGSKRSKAGDNK